MTDFASFESYNATPRLASLALSPDGTRLVTVVSTLAADGKTWQGALWEVDPTGEREAVRLTRSAKGDSSPVFAPDGSLLFLSARLGATTAGIGWPVTSRQVSMTCFTEKPVPLPRL